MKITLKTLKGTLFGIEVKPEDTIADVKKTIETTKGADTYPAAQQVLINQGKVLNDGTTLTEINVLGPIIILVRKNKGSPAEGSTTSNAPTLKAPQTSAPSPASAEVATSPPAVVPAPALIPSSNAVSDIFHEASSNLVADNNLEVTIQQILEVSVRQILEVAIQKILDMGGGTWDRDTAVRALLAACYNPEYLNIGIPESAEEPPTSRSMSSGQAYNVPAQSQQPAEPAPLPSTGPNANPHELFPQVLPSVGSNSAGANALNFLSNSPRVPNPQLLRMIQENQANCLRRINEPIEGGEGDPLGKLAGPIPQDITVTPEERESIERLKTLGFDQDIVLQVFFACDKNEMVAARYLFDHLDEFQ